MDNNNIYANVNPTPVQGTGQSSNGQEKSAYNQQTVYGQQTTYGQQTYNTNVQNVTRCPGKEIAGLVLGINSLVWSVLAAFLSWIPFYGLIFGFIWGGFGIGFAIATNILHRKVMEQATLTTNKIHIGKKLAKAGLIVGIISIAVAVTFCIIWVAVIGVAAMSSGGMSILNSLGNEMSRNPQSFNF